MTLKELLERWSNTVEQIPEMSDWEVRFIVDVQPPFGKSGGMIHFDWDNLIEAIELERQKKLKKIDNGEEI